MNGFIKQLVLVAFLSVEASAATCVDGVTALVNPSIRTGVEEIQRFVRITKTNPTKLASSETVLEAIPTSTQDAFMKLADGLLRGTANKPAVAANLEHVENQHLKPLERDAADLKEFGIDPSKLKLLMLAHDLGKVELPRDMQAALNKVFPTDFVAREILTHEYASMHHVERLGKAAGMSPKEIFAIQTLIANHNFGPDLTRSENVSLRGDWWPANFREKLLPKLAGLGVKVEEVFSRTEDGNYQYGNAEGSRYSELLSAYDRGIANEFNQYGIQTWQKFAQQDYMGYQNALKANPEAQTSFSGTNLVNRMKTSAAAADLQIDAMWRPIAEKAGSDFDLKAFAPYVRMKEGVKKLQLAIEKVAKDNPVTVNGSVNYVAKDGTLFRVDDRHSKGLKPVLLKWENSSWQEVGVGESPVQLLFDVIKKDQA